VGNLSREEAASALRGELRALAVTASAVSSTSFAAWLADLGGTIEELGGIGAFLHGEPLRVFVVDEDDGLRDRVALAIESLGHATRTAESLRELARAAALHAPDVVIVAASLAGDRPDVGFADLVRELARSEKTQVIVYVTTPQAPGELDVVARVRGARGCFCPISTKVDALAAQLAPILDDVAW
jgi:CheY-like chemotaxis protein